MMLANITFEVPQSAIGLAFKAACLTLVLTSTLFWSGQSQANPNEGARNQPLFCG